MAHELHATFCRMRRTHPGPLGRPVHHARIQTHADTIAAGFLLERFIGEPCKGLYPIPGILVRVGITVGSHSYLPACERPVYTWNRNRGNVTVFTPHRDSAVRACALLFMGAIKTVQAWHATAFNI